jgi:molybdopterin molybdotransferase
MTLEYSGDSSYVGLAEALSLVGANTGPLPAQELSLSSCPGYVSAEDVHSAVTSPQRPSSLKDGFAVRSQDVTSARAERPVVLILMGAVFAGGRFAERLEPGHTVKILSGAHLPDGADAVVSAEFCNELPGKVVFRLGAEEGKNVMPAGAEVTAGDIVVASGDLLTPARLGYAATAGLSRLSVFRKPRMAVISIGDELVNPGQNLEEGQIYASNAVNIGAWLSLLGIPYATATVRDDRAAIRAALQAVKNDVDAVLTIGGAMHSERDLIDSVLEDLGSQELFRHVRMGPGKGTSFRRWGGVPVFSLSGSPSSCTVGFVVVVLPGVCRMVGLPDSHFSVAARLLRDVGGRQVDWTEVSEASLVRDEEGTLSVAPCSRTSRSGSMADAECLLLKPEGVDLLRRGESVAVRLLSPLLPLI